MQKYLKHQTKREELFKFLILLAIVIGYFAYLSWKYDLATGGVVSVLTWSFFVLCTPVADAGFLLDFPIRLLVGIRMFTTEIVVWVLAMLINVVFINLAADSYATTFLTALLFKILTTPWPYWCVIILCAIGTFMSIRFGDEMLDVIAHKDRQIHHSHGFKYRLVAMAALFGLIFVAYYFLLEKLDIDISSLL